MSHKKTYRDLTWMSGHSLGVQGPGLLQVDRLRGEACTQSQLHMEYCIMGRETLLVETV